MTLLAHEATVSPINILIGGDLCPVNRYERIFIEGDPHTILGSFVPLALSADLFVSNLECPLIEHPAPIVKTGPVLGVSPRCSAGLKSIGLHALGLANNHIMDHGASGLYSTLSACASEGISVFGAGATLEEARRIHVYETKGMRIGLCAMAEREWSLATPQTPGASPLDLLDFVRQMREVKKKVDFLIVLLHAGGEGYEMPSPDLMNKCRFLVEEGANIVTCQHSHCVGTYENYQGQLIVYGQGNFIFDYASHGISGKRGIFIAVGIEADGSRHTRLLPFTQKERQGGIEPLPELENMKLMQEFEKRSETILDPQFLYNAWESHCDKRKLVMLNKILGYGRFLRRLNKNGLLIDIRGKSYIKNLLDIVQNESASEALFTSLRAMLKETENHR